MKKLLLLLVCCLTASAQDTSGWQPVMPDEQKQIDSIKQGLPDVQPLDAYFTTLCTFIERKDYAYEDRLWQMSGVDPKDARLVIIAKVQKMMYGNWPLCRCNNISFGDRDGNLLKYSVNRNFSIFVDDMVETYGIDINKIDPANGETLLDFMEKEIDRYRKLSNSAERVKELREIANHFVEDYGAKHASELKN